MRTDAPSPAGRARLLRVFISSTFRDMQAERDELVKRIFPRLRALCRARQVEWSEVDLRWGIPDEQVAEGRVLPICLAEIEACRPYFIGLLADRYGWIPEALPTELVEAEPWLAEYRGRSVTELEIVRGVLADPAMAEHAFFYFRDPAWAASVPAERRADFVESSPGQARLLEDLKARIRQSGLPVRENYPDPRALGELVYADLAAVIDRLFPERRPAERWQSEREEQEFYAASLRTGYVVRPAHYEALDRHAAGAGPPLLVVGLAGAGKSALLANWIVHHRERVPEVPVFSHFAGASGAADDADLAMWRLVAEIREFLDLPPARTPRSPADLRRLFVETLNRTTRRIVVVIDGLESMRLSLGSPGAEWVPREVADSVRLIVSTARASAFSYGMPAWPGLVVSALEPAERRRLAEEYLGRYAKSLAGPLLDRIVANDGCRSPLFLRLVLDELRVFGDHDRLAARIEHYLDTPWVAELYQRILARWEADYDLDRPHLVRDAFRLLLASRTGLAESELLDLLGDGGPLPQGVWAPLHAGIAGSVVFRSGRLVLANGALRHAVSRRYVAGPDVKRALHQRLADYFNRQGLIAATLDELPFQLQEAGDWDPLARLLSLPEYLSPAWQERPGDVRRFWAAVEAGSPIRMRDAMVPLLAADSLDPAAARAAAVLLYDFNHYPEAERMASRWAAQSRNDTSSDLSAALHLVGAARARQGNLSGAMASYDEEERIARAAGDDETLEFALQGQALVALQQGDLDRSAELFGRIEAAAISAGRDGMAAVAIDNLALLRLKRGDAPGALALHERAEILFRRAGDEMGVARSFGNRGAILVSLGRLDEAAAAYEAAEDWFRRLGDGATALRTMQERANLLFRLKAFDAAVDVCRAHAELARQLDDLESLQGGLGNEAVALRELGRFEDAVVRLEEQAAVCREIPDPEREGSSLLRRAAVLHNRLKRTDEAAEVARSARDLAIRAGLPDLRDDADAMLRMLGARKEEKP